MRISIWSYDANPLVDSRLLKKSLSSCEADVEAGLLRWVNPNDKAQGCVGTMRFRSREFHPSMEHAIAAGSMRDAWVTRQSGFAGPLVLQMPTKGLSL
jgi:hypothetical protein